MCSSCVGWAPPSIACTAACALRLDELGKLCTSACMAWKPDPPPWECPLRRCLAALSETAPVFVASIDPSAIPRSSAGRRRRVAHFEPLDARRSTRPARDELQLGVGGDARRHLEQHRQHRLHRRRRGIPRRGRCARGRRDAPPPSEALAALAPAAGGHPLQPGLDRDVDLGLQLLAARPHGMWALCTVNSGVLISAATSPCVVPSGM